MMSPLSIRELVQKTRTHGGMKARKASTGVIAECVKDCVQFFDRVVVIIDNDIRCDL